MASLIALAGGAIINALAFSGSNYVFSKLSNHGEAERKRHDFALEKLGKDREKWNEERLQKLDHINKRLREQKQASEYIKNLEEGMLEYYQVFGKTIKPLRKYPQITEYYHPSKQQKNGEMAFIIVGISLMTYGILKYSYNK